MKKDHVLRAAIDARNLDCKLFGKGQAARTRKLVFLTIATYANSDGTRAYPSEETLAKECGIKPRQIRNVITWLENEGWIEVGYKKGPRGTNVFTVFPTDPATRIATSDPAIGEAVSGNAEAIPGNGGAYTRQQLLPITERPYRPRERETRPTGSRDGAGQVIKEIARAGGTVTGKDVAAIKTLMAEKDWTDAEIILGTRKILDKLDSFEMKQAGDRVSSNLDSEISLEREHTAETARNQELIQSETERARQDVERELRELASEGIEEHL